MVTSNYPVSHQVVTKIAKITRTDTSAKELFQIPAGALITDVRVFSPAVSDAGTTAVVSVGDGSSATKYLDTVDVKSAAGMIRPTSKLANALTAVALGYESIFGIYAETGTASTVGTFYVILEYIHVGPGEIIN